MKKIKTINKLLSSLTLLSPLSGIGFNSQYQATQKIITENSNSSQNNYFSSNAQEKMGDITVNVDGTTITGYVEGTGRLEVSSNITEIGDSAFLLKTTEITSLDLSHATSLTTIENKAFSNCTKLAGDLVIPSSVTSIGDYAFNNSIITSLDLSHATSLTNIGSYAFSSCEKISGTIQIPSGITTIKTESFKYILGEINLDLSQATSLTTIEDRAFQSSTNLTGDLYISDKLTIATQAFESTNHFTSIELDSNNPNYTLATNLGPDAYVLLDKKSNGIYDPDNYGIMCNIACGKFVFPSNIEKTGDFNNKNITSVDFSKAKNLLEITTAAFFNCPLTDDIAIPNKVTSIGRNAFSHTFITSLDLSQATSLTTIENNAFYDCVNLTGDLVIPSGVTEIQREAFDESNLNNIYFSSETPPTFGTNWQPTITGKVYVPSEEAKTKYTSASNFGFSQEQIEIGLPPEPAPIPKKSNTGLILGLILGLGIPILLAIGFAIWYITKKKKTTVKI